MVDNLERFWVSIQDSDRFRHFIKRGAGSTFFRSRAYRQIYLAKNYLTSYITARRHSNVLSGVKSYCLFIGHNKSGASMIGALLDAHPDVILADEVDALEYIDRGFSRSQLFHVLLRASRREMLKGRVTARRLEPYSWLVPGQWQGRYRRLQVVGDSTSGTSTRRFGRDPNLLSRLEKQMADVNVRFILVIRNPFDPISLIMIRGRRSFENALEHYFSNCEIVESLRNTINNDNLFPIRYEDFINHPKSNLSAVCRYLGIEVGNQYLDDCASILDKTPQQSRHLIHWEDKWIKTVENKMGQFSFLQGYSFDQ